MDNRLGFLWAPCPGGARLLRLFGDSPCPDLPPRIAGLPLVEVGPYCFAARERPAPDARFWAAQGGPEEFSHAICGDFVRRVTLPDPVRILHSAAFYNCRALEELCVGPGIESLGSDLFTNCRLQRFVLRSTPHAATGLKKLLGAVTADIGVAFCPNGTVAALLFYPEYFEYLDENTPAHIFNRSIEGEGYRYRQCFDGGVLNFAEYDAAFARACDSETEPTLCQIALGRLRAPYALSAGAQAAYAGYLKVHPGPAVAAVTAARDAAGLRLLCQQELLDADARRNAALLCGQEGWSEGATLLLGDPQKRRSAPKRYDFEDF